MYLLIAGVVFSLLTCYKLTQWLLLPSYSAIVYVKRGKEIRIQRDEHGIPHIHADSFEDGIFGLGYAQAQDRAWQMNLRRLAAKGQLGSVFGYKVLDLDKFFMSIDYLPSCERIVATMDQESRSLLQSFADGINQGIKGLTLLPLEFQLFRTDFPEWTLLDSVAVAKLQSFLLANDYHVEMMRSLLLENFDRESVDLLSAVGAPNNYRSDISVVNKAEFKGQPYYSEEPFAQILRNIESSSSGPSELKETFELLMDQVIPLGGGSNAFVIHGNHTTTGFPILASDPHLDNALPSAWYQAEIRFQDNYVAGAALSSTPYLLSARSKYLSWGVTVLYSDTTDLYEEQLKRIDGQLHYLYQDQWHRVKEKKVTIHYGVGKTYEMTVYRTHHGPILNYYYDDKGTKQVTQPSKYYSLRSLIDLDDSKGVSCFLKFVQEKDLKTALEHLKSAVYPALGMVFASHHDIAYMPIGKLIRKSGHPDEYAYIKKGWTGENEWQELLDPPYFLNPAKGYFATANGNFFPLDDKLFSSWNLNPSGRQVRLEEALKEMVKNKISIEQVKRLQQDTVDVFACDSLPHIFKKLSPDTVQQHSFFIKHLRNWNCSLTLHSTEATLYSLFEFYYFKTFANMPNRWAKTYQCDSFHFKNIQELRPNSPWCANPKNSTSPCIENVVDSVKQAVDHFGSLRDKSWSAIHTHYLPHQPLAKQFYGYFDRWLPYKGNRRTLGVSVFDPTQIPFLGYHGPNYRMVVSMRPGDKSVYVLDTGISGNFLSQHYDDQFGIWAQGEYVAMQADKYEHLTVLKPSQITNDEL